MRSLVTGFVVFLSMVSAARAQGVAGFDVYLVAEFATPNIAIATPQVVLTHAPSGCSLPMLGGVGVHVLDDNRVVEDFDGCGNLLGSFTIPSGWGSDGRALPAACGVMTGLPHLGPDGPAISNSLFGIHADRATNTIYVFSQPNGYAIHLRNLTTTGGWSTRVAPGEINFRGLAFVPSRNTFFMSRSQNMVAEFQVNGDFVACHPLPFGASSGGNAFGFSYIPATNRFLFVDGNLNGACALYEWDAFGPAHAVSLVAHLPAWGIGCATGLDYDPGTQLLAISGRSGSTLTAPRKVWLFHYAPNEAAFSMYAKTSFNGFVGQGDLTLKVVNVPSATIAGLTLMSATLPAVPGGGPAATFGFIIDPLTELLLGLQPLPAPGGPIFWTWPVAGLYPAAPFSFPPGSLGTGTPPFDFISAALLAGGGIACTNVARIRF